jgi:hypothetical protein
MLFMYTDDAGQWVYPRAVQDEIQMMAFHMWWWTVDAVDQGTVALSRTDDKGKVIKETFRVSDRTRVWKGRKPGTLDTLKVGDKVLFQTRYDKGLDRRFADDLLDENGLEAVRAAQKERHAEELADGGLPAVVNEIDVLKGSVRVTVQWEAADAAKAIKPGSSVVVLRSGKDAKRFEAPVVENTPDEVREKLLLAPEPGAAAGLRVGDEVRVSPKAEK